MPSYQFARVYVDTEDRDRVRAILPETAPNVAVEVRRSDEWPAARSADFTTWRTQIEVSQSSDAEDQGIVAVTSAILGELVAAGYAAVVSAPFEEECRSA